MSGANEKRLRCARCDGYPPTPEPEWSNANCEDCAIGVYVPVQTAPPLVVCTVCKTSKTPVGRSAGPHHLCHAASCEGWRLPPHPTQYWSGETMRPLSATQQPEANR